MPEDTRLPREWGGWWRTALAITDTGTATLTLTDSAALVNPRTFTLQIVPSNDFHAYASDSVDLAAIGVHQLFDSRLDLLTGSRNTPLDVEYRSTNMAVLPASGTVTVAVVGIPAFWLLHRLPPVLYAIFLAVFIILSVWIHERGDRILGQKDSRMLVWDELAGFFVAVAFLPFSLPIALAAFVLERALDIAKAPPANWIERRWPGGWGVVGDDLVAGLYTAGILHAVHFWRPAWLMG